MLLHFLLLLLFLLRVAMLLSLLSLLQLVLNILLLILLVLLLLPLLPWLMLQLLLLPGLLQPGLVVVLHGGQEGDVQRRRDQSGGRGDSKAWQGRREGCHCHRGLVVV